MRERKDPSALNHEAGGGVAITNQFWTGAWPYQTQAWYSSAGGLTRLNLTGSRVEEAKKRLWLDARGALF